MNCTICNKPIVLRPTAAERAAKDMTGKSAAYYTSLFTTHSACAVAKRGREVSELIVRNAELKAAAEAKLGFKLHPNVVFCCMPR